MVRMKYYMCHFETLIELKINIQNSVLINTSFKLALMTHTVAAINTKIEKKINKQKGLKRQHS
jgi:hypothetical protein